jgi:S-adenosylmethionine uptake transporter
MSLLLVLGAGTGSATFDPVWPDTRDWLLLLSQGALATVSHFFLTAAFGNAPASILAPLQYLAIVSATGLGYLAFGDYPGPDKWLGILIIVGSGIFIIFRERRLRGAR